MVDTPTPIDGRVQVPELGIRPRAIPAADPHYRQLIGRGRIHPVFLYDSFTRANSSNIGKADSGQPWSEALGNFEIISNILRVVSGAGESVVAAWVAPQMVATGRLYFVASGVVADIDVGIIMRYKDVGNYLLARLDTNSFDLFKRVGGVWTQLATQAITAIGNRGYTITVELDGGAVDATLQEAPSATGQSARITARNPADTLDPFIGATAVGIRIFNDVADSARYFAVRCRS